MEKQKEILGMLDLMIQPGVCVKEKKIVKVNQAAQGLLLCEGTDIRELLLTGQEEYAAFSEGCLYLSLSIAGHPWGASVFRMETMDVFLLDQVSDQGELRSLALAARELRSPLGSALLAAASLLKLQETPEAREQASRLNQELYQLLRVVGNMSDAVHYPPQQETQNIVAVLEEIFEKAQTLLEHTGVELSYQTLEETIYCLTDRNQLERAVYNILSNAVKFSPRGGRIQASLTRRGRFLRLSIQDSGSGIAGNILSSLHQRYLRQPSLEDSRHGIGLGMVLIRTAAANHGGAVLIDQPDGSGTRVTMTLAIRQSTDNALHSPVMRLDYSGGYDHGLVELSGCLPHKLYDLS